MAKCISATATTTAVTKNFHNFKQLAKVPLLFFGARQTDLETGRGTDMEIGRLVEGQKYGQAVREMPQTELDAIVVAEAGTSGSCHDQKFLPL